MVSVFSSAVALAAQGLAVLPVHGVTQNGRCSCGRNPCEWTGKHPRTKRGHHEATTDLARIGAWFERVAPVNLGVRTGGGLVVLDVDPRNGGEASLAEVVREHGELPRTWRVITGGGGDHYYFMVRGDRVRTRPGFRRGLDLKAEGGFVVAPPSRHASGKLYRWADGLAPHDCPRAPAPDWLLASARERGPGPARAGAVEHGRRNTYLTSFAGRARRGGLGGDALFALLVEENERTCVPALPRAEIERIVRSVSRYPAGHHSRIDEVLQAAGVASLKESSAVADRESVLRKVITSVERLDTLERALVRDELVRRHGFPAPVIDAALRCSAPALDAAPQGRPLGISDIDPWPEPINGTRLLDELAVTLQRYAALPEHAAEALALWVVHTHAIEAAQITPRLALLSPEKRCGKTTVLKLLAGLVRRPLTSTNVTAAALFRTVEMHEPTLLVDEIDTFLSDSEELRGLLNTGHDRAGADVIRLVGDEHEPRRFRTWGPVALAGIGKIPDTLRDRSIVVSMKRRAEGERVEPLRRAAGAGLTTLSRKCARWARDNKQHLATLSPEPLPALDDRANDNWEPLLAIADAAGGDWPAHATRAAVGLSGATEREERESRGQQLLGDVRAIYERRQALRIVTKELVDELNRLEDRPWPEYSRGKGLTPLALSRILQPFGVRPMTVRLEAGTAKGYRLEDFQDAFERYLPTKPSLEAVTSVTSVTTAEILPVSLALETSQAPDAADAADRGNSTNPAVVTDVTGVTALERVGQGDEAEKAYAKDERGAIKQFGS